MTPREYAGWLADKIPAYGDYAKEAALVLIRQAEEIERLRYHLTELGKFADRAGLVLAVLEADDTTEEEQLQEIIDGISAWAAPAILGDVKGPNVLAQGRPEGEARREPDGVAGRASPGAAGSASKES